MTTSTYVALSMSVNIPESESQAITRDVCDAVFYQLHDELRMYLNFHSIYPFLNNYQLLHGSLDQSILTDPKTTSEKKVDIVVGWLPKCKQSDYLTPFVACLRESSEQAGDAHLELADEFERLIQEELQKKRKRRKCPGLILNAKRRFLIGCSFLTLSLTVIVWLISTIVFARALPTGIATEEKIFYNATIPLLSNIDKQWLLSVDIHFKENGCKGKAVVVDGIDCSDMPKKTSHVGENDNLCRIYALPGSWIKITLLNDFPHNRNLWFTHTLEAMEQLYCQLGSVRCPSQNSYGNIPDVKCGDQSLPQDYSCFPSGPYNGSFLIFNVTKPGWYCFIQSNQQDTKLSRGYVDWSYYNITYDFDVIVSNYSAKMMQQSGVTVKGMEKSTLKLSHFFNFTERKTCALLNFLCEYEYHHDKTLVFSNFKHRADIIAVTLFIFLLLVFFCCFLMFGLYRLLKI